ncbi:unnamed protein product [Phytophthora lilii]|uniref:Unnamed protein product n=1 Tax=Phytophthora lilii TaxID=2077276 RepID=A0A9W6XPN1_9STRA|nr:unnamed protein product [Phytophthora lilii]
MSLLPVNRGDGIADGAASDENDDWNFPPQTTEYWHAHGDNKPSKSPPRKARQAIARPEEPVQQRPSKIKPALALSVFLVQSTMVGVLMTTLLGLPIPKQLTIASTPSPSPLLGLPGRDTSVLVDGAGRTGESQTSGGRRRRRRTALRTCIGASSERPPLGAVGNRCFDP